MTGPGNRLARLLLQNHADAIIVGYSLPCLAKQGISYQRCFLEMEYIVLHQNLISFSISSLHISSLPMCIVH